MPLDLWNAVVFTISIVATVGITFYVKDYLQKRQEFSKLRSKLEKIAGKNAFVLYNPFSEFAMPGFGLGVQKFKIAEIDRFGITLENELQTIFVPSAKLLQSEMILPAENYETIRADLMKQGMDKYMGQISQMMPEMMDKYMDEWLPKMMSTITDQMYPRIQESMVQGKLGGVIGTKIQGLLQDEGYEIKRLRE